MIRLLEFTNAEAWDGPFEVIECKKALSLSKLPGTKYSLNPYGGCTHGCVYCYAPEVLHAEWNTWRVVKVKANVARRLSKEIPGLYGVIGLGTVTDPYQDPERRFELTRSCLEVLRGNRELSVSILTKSNLILRDTELIGSLKHNIGISVSTIEDRMSKRIEPGVPLPERRLAAVNGLKEAGLNAYVFVAPVTSVLDGKERELADRILQTEADYVLIDTLNPRPLLSERLQRMNVTSSVSSAALVKRYLEEGGMRVIDAYG